MKTKILKKKRTAHKVKENILLVREGGGAEERERVRLGEVNIVGIGAMEKWELKNKCKQV